MRVGEIAALARGALGEAMRREVGEVRRWPCGVCGVELVGLRPDVCRGCTQRESVVDIERARAERLMIPPCFQWARLNLEPFTWRQGGPVVVHPKALEAVRRFRGTMLVLRGATGSGKTSLAAAWLMAQAAEGMSAVFVECIKLPPDAPNQALAGQLLYAARRARAVVIDDLGKDLGGAPYGQHLAAYRAAPVCALINEIFSRQRSPQAQRVVITAGLDDDLIRGAYGPDILRRVSPDNDHPHKDTLELWLTQRTSRPLLIEEREQRERRR